MSDTGDLITYYRTVSRGVEMAVTGERGAPFPRQFSGTHPRFL
jgi:hypothetical protein